MKFWRRCALEETMKIKAMKILSLLIAISFLFSLVACTDNADNTGNQGNGQLAFKKLSNDTYEVSVGGATAKDSIVIPDTYQGLPVTRIADRAFANCTGLKSITVPESVTEIGSYAFYFCTALESIKIPVSVTKIGFGAFTSCHKLDKVYTDDVAKWCAISFENDGANPLKHGHNLYVGETAAETLTIPEGVEVIEKYAFYGLRNSKSVVLPNTLKTIGAFAFSGASSLTIVDIPDSVTNIGDSAFARCTSLLQISLPSSLSTIGNLTFHYCSALTNITIPASITSIESYAFRDCTSLSMVMFEDPNGWSIAESSGAIAGTPIQPKTFESPETVASYLRQNYRSYYWTRSYQSVNP